jgi:pimeloyl-ACP methyl ester carboxylesterase
MWKTTRPAWVGRRHIAAHAPARAAAIRDQITVPVLVVVGEDDALFCTGVTA